MVKPIVAHIVWNYLPLNHGYIYNQMTRLTGYDSAVLCERYTPDCPPAPMIRFMYQVGTSLKPRAVFFKSLRRLWPAGYARWFEKKAVDAGADLVHIHFGTMARVLASLPRRFRLPIVVTFYGNDASQDLRENQEAYQRLFSFADLIVVQGEAIKERFVGLGCAPEKIRIWDIGIDLARLPYIPRETSCHTINFLVAARFTEKKGYFVLLEAFQRLRQVHPNVKLTIVGFGPLEGRIRSYIDSNQLGSAVEVVSTQAVPDFYSIFIPLLQSHHIFVLPSMPSSTGDEDGLPVVIQDAQACGLPVVTCPVGAIPHAVIHRETGLLATPGSVDSLFIQMEYLVRNRAEWNRIGKQARLYAEKRFAIKKQLERLESFYNSVNN